MNDVQSVATCFGPFCLTIRQMTTLENRRSSTDAWLEPVLRWFWKSTMLQRCRCRITMNRTCIMAKHDLCHYFVNKIVNYFQNSLPRIGLEMQGSRGGGIFWRVLNNPYLRLLSKGVTERDPSYGPYDLNLSLKTTALQRCCPISGCAPPP